MAVFIGRKPHLVYTPLSAGSGVRDDLRVVAGEPDQLADRGAAETTPLMVRVNGDIREVRAVEAIRQDPPAPTRRPPTYTKHVNQLFENTVARRGSRDRGRRAESQVAEWWLPYTS